MERQYAKWFFWGTLALLVMLALAYYLLFVFEGARSYGGILV